MSTATTASDVSAAFDAVTEQFDADRPAPAQAETPDPRTDADPATPGPQAVRAIGIDALAAHPGNVRAEVTPDAEFVSSVRAEGIRIPLLITGTSEPGVFRIIDGHKRFAAARKVGLTEVPYTFDAARAADEAGQYLDMLITSRYKTPLTPFEESAALFAAAQAGASRTRLAKAYGKREQVADALTVAGLPQATKTAAIESGYEWTLSELAALHQFAQDPAATARLIEAAEDDSFSYQVEREILERDELARREAIRADLTAAGVRVLDEEPDAGRRLIRLRTGDGADLDEQAHAACPGHVAVFERYGEPRVSYFCEDFAAHGHVDRWASSGANPSGGASGTPESKAEASAARRLVIRGNKDHKAAEINRRKWLTELLARTSLSREDADLITRFSAETYLSMPEPLRKYAADYQARERQAEFLGLSSSKPEAWSGAVTTAGQRRLILLTFAPVATAYEKALNNDMWRTDTSSYIQSGRTDARRWLECCKALGHALAPIERAIAAGETYAPADLSPATTITDSDPDDGTAQDTQDSGQDADGSQPTDEESDESEQ
jgi:ParB family chromosome partitioning protein